MLLKIELDLRSQQYFFLSYLACIRSSVYPQFDGELSKVPSIRGIQKKWKGEKEKKGSRYLILN
jgi:hypothetical protein